MQTVEPPVVVGEFAVAVRRDSRTQATILLLLTLAAAPC